MLEYTNTRPLVYSIRTLHSSIYIYVTGAGICRVLTLPLITCILKEQTKYIESIQVHRLMVGTLGTLYSTLLHTVYTLQSGRMTTTICKCNIPYSCILRIYIICITVERVEYLCNTLHKQCLCKRFRASISQRSSTISQLHTSR